MRIAKPRILTHEFALRLTLIGFSFALLFATGEILCRLFFPDTRLRYVTDQEALFYFEPNQVGTIDLANGSTSLPVRINQLGFRGPDLEQRRGHQFLVLGDSLTFGWGVSDDQTFVSRLDRAFGDEVSVLNGGQPGYGVFQMAATLRRVGEQLRPELVILVLWQGDLLREPPDVAERDQFFLRRRLLQFFKTSVFLTHVYRRVERLLLRFGAESLVLRVRDTDGQAGLDSEAIVNLHLRGFEADSLRLLAMHHQALRYGRGLFLVLWPKEDFANDAEPGLAQKLTETVEAFARQHRIPFISLQSAMRRRPSTSLVIPNDWHPTPLAHCLAAEHIADQLVRLGFRMMEPVLCSVGDTASYRPPQ